MLSSPKWSNSKCMSFLSTIPPSLLAIYCLLTILNLLPWGQCEYDKSAKLCVPFMFNQVWNLLHHHIMLQPITVIVILQFTSHFCELLIPATTNYCLPLYCHLLFMHVWFIFILSLYYFFNNPSRVIYNTNIQRSANTKLCT